MRGEWRYVTRLGRGGTLLWGAPRVSPLAARCAPRAFMRRNDSEPPFRTLHHDRPTRALGKEEGGVSDSDEQPPPPPPQQQQQQEQAGAFAYGRIAADLERLDANQLQTALATAIAAEDYALAAAIRDRFARLMGGDGSDGGEGGEGGSASSSGGATPARVLDWEALGLHSWVADRAARLGLRFPTGESKGPRRWPAS